MIKRMTLLQRRDDLSITAFRDHWAGGHAQLALSMDGVVKYTQNIIEENLVEVASSNEAPFAPDGIVELYFRDAEAMAKAQQSETGRLVIPTDEPRFLRGWTLCIVSTDGPHDYEGAKVLVPGVLAPSVSIEDVKSELAAARSDGQAGLVAFAFNHVLETAKRPGLWCEPTPPQVIVALWFRSQDAARLFCSDDQLRRVFAKASACLASPAVIR